VDPLAVTLLLLGCGFLVANLWLSAEFVSYLRRRRQALLTWPGPRPRYYGVMLATGVVLGLLVFVKLVFQRRPVEQAFGELMMFAYYGYLVPLSRRIGRGFYEDGIWSESGFMRYGQIGGITWREGEELTLVLISRMRHLARKLVVPATHYGAVRRLLRDKIAAHDIHFSGTSLDLGGHDEREDV
jgi:hypothetical protein